MVWMDVCKWMRIVDMTKLCVNSMVTDALNGGYLKATIISGHKF